ncbi:hypothetical protein ACFL4E_02655 [Candidatus Omnitrophota bacterium]
MKKLFVIMLIGLMVLPAVMCLAEGEDPITGTVKTVGRAAEGTVKTAVSPIEALGEGKPGNIISDPVDQGGKTVYQATDNTGKALTGRKVD